jgi:hypothetical protein
MCTAPHQLWLVHKSSAELQPGTACTHIFSATSGESNQAALGLPCSKMHTTCLQQAVRLP